MTVTELHDAYAEEIEGLEDLPQAEKDRLRSQLEDHRKHQTKAPRATTKALAASARETVANLQTEVSF